MEKLGIVLGLLGLVLAIYTLPELHENPVPSVQADSATPAPLDPYEAGLDGILRYEQVKSLDDLDANRARADSLMKTEFHAVYAMDILEVGVEDLELTGPERRFHDTLVRKYRRGYDTKVEMNLFDLNDDGTMDFLVSITGGSRGGYVEVYLSEPGRSQWRDIEVNAIFHEYMIATSKHNGLYDIVIPSALRPGKTTLEDQQGKVYNNMWEQVSGAFFTYDGNGTYDWGNFQADTADLTLIRPMTLEERRRYTIYRIPMLGP